jgi:hypothetical protein
MVSQMQHFYAWKVGLSRGRQADKPALTSNISIKIQHFITGMGLIEKDG